MTTLNFLIVDDDFCSRIGMMQTLSSMYSDSSVLEARSLGEAQDCLSRTPFISFILLDLNIDDSRGIETLRSTKRWCEEANYNPRILVVSGAADYDSSLISEAIESCATGFITKGSSAEIFRLAIEITVAGSIYIPEHFLRSRRSATGKNLCNISFTKRERQVAALLVQGLTYKQIARRLEQPGMAMSDNTVRVHVQRMAWKLRVTDDVHSGRLSAKAAVLTAFAEQRLSFPD